MGTVPETATRAAKLCYLDNNATTPVAPEVVEAMMPFFKEQYGNPSSMHAFGGRVRHHVEKAREKVAALLGASADEIIFTSCGTESDNLAIRGVAEAFPEKRHFVTTTVEHPAVRNVFSWLARQGYPITELPVDGEGMLDPAQYRAALRPDTALVSVMAANNETGVLFPVEEMAALAQEKGVLFHTDAVQAAGKVPLNLSRNAINLLSLSGHKLHAPKGIGVLYLRRRTRIRPLLLGGGQERGRRGGTENVPYIVGLGKACELVGQLLPEETCRLKRLRDRLEQTILRTISGTRLNGHLAQRLPNTTNISFSYVEGEAILLLLSELGICASSGSACSSGSLEPSPVLLAMGIPHAVAHGSVRFSLSRFNTEEEIDYLLAHLGEVIGRLREISPFSPLPDRKEIET